jgi:hypothetical protein
MKTIKGACFRICNACEIFKVTQADDDHKRAIMAEHFSKLFDQDFKPEDINCDGCTIEGGRLYRFAAECSIRRRELKNECFEKADGNSTLKKGCRGIQMFS